MKDPKTNKKKSRVTSGEPEVLGFCPYCRILSPTLAAEKRRLGTIYTISCICRESQGKKICSRNRAKAIKEWREQHVE